MSVLAGTDFFTAEVLTWRGLVTYYVLFFIHLDTRRVWIAESPSTPIPYGKTIHLRMKSMSCRDGSNNVTRALRSFVSSIELTCTDSRVASALCMENDIHSLLCFQRVRIF
jgi:hypothetical protein